MNDFQTALAQIDEWIQPTGVAGAAAAIWHRGEIVAEHQTGSASPGVPTSAETLFALASVSKPISAATVMTAVEDGLLALDEPVCRFVPEFGPPVRKDAVDSRFEAAREMITVRHLLSHTSGLPEDLGRGVARWTELPSLEQVTDEHVRSPLHSAPGEMVRYSNSGYAILGRVIERIDGASFWDRARHRLLHHGDGLDVVAQPVGANVDRTAYVTDAAHADTSAESYNSEYWRGLAIPWGGLYGTPAALAAFAGWFLPSGTGGPLRASTRGLMIADQARGVPGGVESGRVWWPAASWGLGWEVKGVKRRHWTGDLTSPDTFCHFGQAGTLVWGDPRHDIALAVFTNRSVARVWSFILTRWVRLSNAVVTAASE